MNQTLVGLFDRLTDAHMAKHELVVEGFSEHDIAVNAYAGAASDNSMDQDSEQQGGFMQFCRIEQEGSRQPVDCCL